MYNNKICGIYKITNIIDNKAIIGQSVNILNRWKAYRGSLRSGHYRNQHLQEAWDKDGEQNFKFEVVLECLKENLNKEEKRLIKGYKTNDRNFGYNIEAGGNLHCSDETRKKLSELAKLRKGWFTMSEEQKKKISETMKGHKHWNYGKKTPEEIKQKISKSNIGKHIVSEKTRIKMSKEHLKPQINERLRAALEWAKLPDNKRKELIERYTSNTLT